MLSVKKLFGSMFPTDQFVEGQGLNLSGPPSVKRHLRQVKALLCLAPVLAAPNFGKSFKLAGRRQSNRCLGLYFSRK